VNFGPHVVKLTPTAFSSELDLRNQTVWFVLFHRPNCPTCQNSYHEFIHASKESLGMIKFGEIEVPDSHFASHFQISNVPAFIIFYPGNYVHWRGFPSWRSMVSAAMQHIPDFSLPVDESWLTDQGIKSAILFSHKSKPPPIWIAISAKFRESEIRIGWANNTAIHELFEVQKVPTSVMIDGQKKLTYHGKIEFCELQETIQGFFNG
jgi:thiol-disulfide isomerase/thioredoxin